MYADRIGMMHSGELWAMGTPHDVLTAENIHAVFKLPVHIMTHPNQDCPLIVPLIPELTPLAEVPETST
jgi:iron complex transport system ATP-binding protein